MSAKSSLNYLNKIFCEPIQYQVSFLDAAVSQVRRVIHAERVSANSGQAETEEGSAGGVELPVHNCHDPSYFTLFTKHIFVIMTIKFYQLKVIHCLQTP